MSAIEKLLEISSDPIAGPTQADAIADPQLKALLQQRNGFWALQNALWVFADNSTQTTPGHNHPEISSWASLYSKTKGVAQAFAVDAIGYPFFTSDYGILQMDLETGVFKKIAVDIEGWADAMLNHFQELSGWKVCKDWQDANGPLPEGYRLMPRMPFVGGGTETADNLMGVAMTEMIGFYAELAAEIRNMPEGGTLDIKLMS